MSQNKNILDTPIEEINTPILKPTLYKKPKKGIKKLKELLKSELDKFSDWILNYVTPQKEKKVNQKVKNLKKLVNKIYEENKIHKEASALEDFLTNFRIKGQEKTDPKVFFHNKKFQIINFLKEKEKMFKVKIILEVEFYKGKDKNIGFFDTDIAIISQTTNLSELYDKWSEKILEDIEKFENKGSGWIFKKIIDLNIHIDKYNPISGSSFLKLPKFLFNKKAIINPINKDNMCFKWAVTTAVHTPKIKPERVSKALRENAEKLNWDGLKFPVSLEDISIFEENNAGLGVNVFGYENEKVYPLRLAKNEKELNIINLLLIQEGEISHYCWIKKMSALLFSQLDKHGHRKFICNRCLNAFTTQEKLDKHLEYCNNQEEIVMKMPDKGSVLSFKNYHHSMRVPFVIYADFECFTEKVEDDETNNTQKYQHHKPSGFCYVVKSDNDIFPVKMVKYTKKNENVDVSKKFVESLEKTVREIYEKTWHKKVKLTDEDRKEYEESLDCHICLRPLNGDKVLDHDHLTGNYRGAAHNSCNLNFKIPKHIPVIFHNLAGYDAHLFIKNLGVSSGKIDCIPNNEEKYISFKKEITVGEFENKQGKTCQVKREIRFIDSFKFMASSLDRLAGNLQKEDFKNAKMYFKEKTDLITRKGVFPYDYFNSMDRLSETQLPAKEEFYSKLNSCDISDKDYEHAQKIWSEFECKTLKDYHDLYLKTDVLLLADVFEKFRDVCLENYKLDPCWYYTAPGLSWDAMLKKTDVKLELLHDPDMLLMFEKGIRGGISVITKRYCKANNKYLEDYDKNEESKFIKYLDANNLYGWAMSQNMPIDGFKFMHKEEIKYWRKYPCILEVDLEYPKELFELHNDYPLAPERMIVNKVEKLIPNLNDKKKYVVHHETLKLYEKLGLKITKVHRGIRFNESKWLAQYIDMNTKLRTAAKNDFEKDFFKLMNNSVFGKTMENIRNRQDIKLCNSEEQAKKIINKPNYKKRTIFSENLVAVHLKKTQLNFNKPIYVGMSILDVSKTLMFDFHYNYIKKKYGEKAELLMSDTDSVMYEIQTDDFYKDIYSDLESKFDTSAYGDHPVIDKKLNKKVIGMMKDETSGVEITEFVGLRPKLYSYKCAQVEEKKAKGVKKPVIKNEISFEDYKECLFSGIEMYRKMNVIRSYRHEIYSETVNKVALSADDNKRIIMPDGINTRAIGWITY